MPKHKHEEVIPENKWWCESCQMKDEMTIEQMKSHVKEAHGYDPTNFKGWRKMLAHADGDTWFSWNYQWTLKHPTTGADIVLTQYTLSPRAKDDMMWWNDE